MRIRRKKWAATELANCSFYIDEPNDNFNKWRELFNNNNPIHLELGCGKGTFIAKLASSNIGINYIAVDMIEAMLDGIPKYDSYFKDKCSDSVKDMLKQKLQQLGEKLNQERTKLDEEEKRQLEQEQENNRSKMKRMKTSHSSPI